MRALRLGTRGSALALAQTRWVAERLPAPTEIVVLRTSGDEGASGGDKSRWVDALEAALVEGSIDLAVHSAKDVPGELADGTTILATPARADAGDVLVGPPLAELPPGARVGTSALRRHAQLRAARPDLEVVDLRGNVDTRLAKWSAGEVDALVLAAAGLQRLDRAPRAAALDGPLFVPAPGQGVLAIQGRAGDDSAREAALAINDPATFEALAAERAAVRALGASCRTPVGVHASSEKLRGFAGLPDGSAWVLDELPGRDGEELARRMLAAGARDILGEADAIAGAREGR